MSALEAWGWVVALVFLLWCCCRSDVKTIRRPKKREEDQPPTFI